MVVSKYLQLWESNFQEITGLIMNLYLSLSTFLTTESSYSFSFFFFLCEILEKRALHAGSINFTSKWTCSPFKSLAR